jgi:hypothetical protein
MQPDSKPPDSCTSTSSDLIDSAKKDGSFLNQIITEDGTLCFLYDV